MSLDWQTYWPFAFSKSFDYFTCLPYIAQSSAALQIDFGLSKVGR